MLDTVRIDDGRDLALFVVLDKQVQIDPLTPQNLGKVAGDARFADAHKSRKCDPHIFFHCFTTAASISKNPGNETSAHSAPIISVSPSAKSPATANAITMR